MSLAAVPFHSPIREPLSAMSPMRGAQKHKHQRCSCPTGQSKSSEAGEGWEGMRESLDPGPEAHSPTTPEFFCCCCCFKCRKLGSLKRYENHHASLLRGGGEPPALFLPSSFLRSYAIPFTQKESCGLYPPFPGYYIVYIFISLYSS